MPRRKTPHTFIDLFAGCGGLSLGLLQSGWEGLFAIEQHPEAFLTLKSNLIDKKQTRPFSGFDWPSSIEQRSYEISAFIKSNKKILKGLAGQVELVAGGPPCQGFSLAGRRNARDPRNQLFRRYLEFVDLVQPKLILVENVPGFRNAHVDGPRIKSKRKRRSFADKLRAGLEPRYVVDDCLVRASRFGVPQVRDRYFVIGVRKDLNYDGEAGWAEAILESVRVEFLKNKGLGLTPVTVKKAIGDLELQGRTLMPYLADSTCNSKSNFKQLKYRAPRRTNKYLSTMREGLNGEVLTSLRLPNHTEDVAARFKRILKSCDKGRSLSEKDRARLGMNKQRTVPLASDKPASTVTTIPDDLIHYSEPRTLTVRECARLQSFPDWFDFQGRYTTGGERRAIDCPRCTQVGNAVPPFVADAWGHALKGLLEELFA